VAQPVQSLGASDVSPPGTPGGFSGVSSTRHPSLWELPVSVSVSSGSGGASGETQAPERQVSASAEQSRSAYTPRAQLCATSPAHVAPSGPGQRSSAQKSPAESEAQLEPAAQALSAYTPAVQLPTSGPPAQKELFGPALQRGSMHAAPLESLPQTVP
jgi:hypothetical protein